VALLAVGWKSVTTPLVDHFHEGEYLGHLRQLAEHRAGDAPFPLLTHGAMDYLPSQLATLLHGVDAAIVGTRAINVLLTGCNLWLLMWMLVELGRRAGVDRALRLTACGLLAALLFADVRDAAALHQRVLNPRDSALLLMMALALLHHGTVGAGRGVALALAVGAVATVAPFWAYDRGLVTLCAFVAFVAGLAWRGRWLDLSAAAAGALATLALLDATRVMGDIGANLDNVRYWLEHAALWRVPFDSSVALRALPLVVLDAAMLVALWRLARAAWRADDRATFTWLAMLAGVALLLLRAALNRPDSVHLYWAIWPALLGTAAAVAPLLGDRVRLRASLAVAQPLAVGRALEIAALALATCLLLWGVARGPTAALAGLVDPRPNARVLSDPDLMRALGSFRTLRPRCVLAWSNSGTIALLADLPHCAGVPYPAFVAPPLERDYLAELGAAPPRAILHDAEAWSARIDGRTMAARLPAVAEFIAAGYVEHARYGRWVVLAHRDVQAALVVAASAIGSNGEVR